MVGASLPAAHRLAEGFLPRRHVLGCEVGAVAGASRPIPRPRPAGATVADSASACLIPRRGASSSDQALVEHDRLQPMLAAKGVDLGKRGLGAEPLPAPDIFDWRRSSDTGIEAAGREQKRASECDHGLVLPRQRDWHKSRSTNPCSTFGCIASCSILSMLTNGWNNGELAMRATIVFAALLPLLASVNAFAAEPGATCGGFAHKECPADQWCNYEPGAACGVGDQTGTCRPKPKECFKLLLPVCACDGKTYSNACEAAQAGFDVFYPGPCRKE
jgi:hypothetical protein